MYSDKHSHNRRNTQQQQQHICARAMTKTSETALLDWAVEVCLGKMFAIHLAVSEQTLMMIDVVALFVLETRNRQIDSN